MLRHYWLVIWDAKLDNFINKQDRFDTFFKDYTKTSYEIGSFKFIVLVKRKKERKKERKNNWKKLSYCVKVFDRPDNNICSLKNRFFYVSIDRKFIKTNTFPLFTKHRVAGQPPNIPLM